MTLRKGENITSLHCQDPRGLFHDPWLVDGLLWVARLLCIYEAVMVHND